MWKTINKQPDSSLILLLAAFGLILSGLGFLVVITLTLGHLHHITDITMIFYYWDKIEFYKHPKKPVYYMNINRYFYEITGFLFGSLVLYYWFSDIAFLKIPIWLLVPAFIISVIEEVYRCTWERYSNECVWFERALKGDTIGYYRDQWDKWFKDPDFRERIIVNARERGILRPHKECTVCRIYHQICKRDP